MATILSQPQYVTRLVVAALAQNWNDIYDRVCLYGGHTGEINITEKDMSGPLWQACWEVPVVGCGPLTHWGQD